MDLVDECMDEPVVNAVSLPETSSTAMDMSLDDVIARNTTVQEEFTRAQTDVKVKVRSVIHGEVPEGLRSRLGPPSRRGGRGGRRPFQGPRLPRGNIHADQWQHDLYSYDKDDRVKEKSDDPEKKKLDDDQEMVETVQQEEQEETVESEVKQVELLETETMFDSVLSPQATEDKAERLRKEEEEKEKKEEEEEEEEMKKKKEQEEKKKHEPLQTVLVHQLHFDILEEDLQALFPDDLKPLVTHIQMIYDEAGRPTGDAVLRTSSAYRVVQWLQGRMLNQQMVTAEIQEPVRSRLGPRMMMDHDRRRPSREEYRRRDHVHRREEGDQDSFQRRYRRPRDNTMSRPDRDSRDRFRRETRDNHRGAYTAEDLRRQRDRQYRPY